MELKDLLLILAVAASFIAIWPPALWVLHSWLVWWLVDKNTSDILTGIFGVVTFLATVVGTLIQTVENITGRR